MKLRVCIEDLEYENNKCYNTENYDTIPVAIYKKDNIGAFFEYNEKIHNINNDETIEWTYSSVLIIQNIF